MYFVLLALLMVVLPVASACTDANPLLTPFWVLLGKWFVFWAVGLRLFLAGVKQVRNPRYTAQVILGLKGEEPLFVVRELGFANLAIGTLGLASPFVVGWTSAAALAGGIFYLLAGLHHARQAFRNLFQNVAMLSDFWAALLLVLFLVRLAFWLHGH